MTAQLPATGLRRWGWVVPLAMAALLTVAVGLGQARLGGFLALSWLDRPLLPKALIMGLVALGFWSAPWPFVARATLVGTIGVLTVGGSLLGLSLISSTGGFARELYRAPDGDRELRVHDAGGFSIDPILELRVRSGSGLTEREWDLGCINGDHDWLLDVEWIGSHQLRLHLKYAEPIDVGMDAATGRPDRQVAVSCNP
jgi:hypothetical protein